MTVPSHLPPARPLADALQAAATSQLYVIDDNSAMRQSLGILLSSIGVEALPFASAPDFLEKMPSLAPAPILLDITMPGMDGIELLAELATRGVKWPVVMMTGLNTMAISMRALEFGAMEILAKPFSAETLEFAIARAFEAIAENASATLRSVAARLLFEQLTPTEIDVISGLTSGASNGLLVRDPTLGSRAAELHCASAMAKLGVGTLAEILCLAATARLDPGRPLADQLRAA